MKKGLRTILTISALLFLSPLATTAQKAAAYYLETEHSTALELFDKQKYAAAQNEFEDVIEAHSPNDLIRIAAEYYSALCALELFNRDAEEKLHDFVADHPDSPWIPQAYFQLGKHHYRKHHYTDCIETFQMVEDNDLSKDQIPEKAFKLGYAYFKRDHFKKASDQFYRIKDEKNDYFGPANYYYAHIAYREGNYQAALENFLKIKDRPGFNEIVPYYLAQIYYRQEKFEKLISYASPLLDTGETERTAEIARMLGEAFYKTERYAESVPYLELYIKRSYGINREDRYQLGYAYMKSGKNEKAIEQFEKVVSRDDSLAQLSYYHMAKVHLEEGKKEYARSAYRSASRLSFDQDIQQDALFHFAKLSYELSFDPYDQAIKAFREYIEKYPDSDRKDQAYEYLTNLYMTTKDYRSALTSLEKIDKNDLKLRAAYQIVAFNRGVQLFQNGHYSNAIKHFKKVREYSVERSLNTKSYYWEAECYSRIGRSNKAIQTFREFRKEPGAFSSNKYLLSYYDVGYVYFGEEEYLNAATEFRKFASNAGDKLPQQVSDALLRTGDSYYMKKEYHKAARFYEKAAEKVNMDKDYALYQLAICQGLLQEQEQKIKSLNELISSHKNSEYLPEAKFQMGRAHLQKEEFQPALNSFEQVVQDHPQSEQANKARLQIGLIHYKKGRQEDALSTFKKVVENRTGYEASKEALQRIKNIYVDLGRMEEYNSYVQNLKGIDISKEEVDEANYESAENLFMKGEYEKAVKAFRGYFKEFDPPNYALNARFYLAEALLKTGRKDQAYKEYQKIIERPRNKFTEPALLTASSLAFNKKKYKKALGYYQELEKVAEFKVNVLESYIGQMRCHFKLNAPQKTLTYADKVLNDQKTPEKVVIEALMKKGKALYELEEHERAIETFEMTIDSTSSEAKAEARYLIGKIHFQQKAYKKTEEQVFKLVHQKPSYDEWVAKGFLLLSDAYMEMGDLFQAKETLKSIIDFYEGEELVEKARNKMERIKKLEKEEAKRDSTREEPKDMEIDLKETKEKYKELYESDTTGEKSPKDPKKDE